MKSIRLLLADDHALVRAGIRALINRLAGMEVVAEAGDGREALRLIEQLQPDVALLDITMPGLNGFEVLDYVTRYSPGVRVIFPPCALSSLKTLGACSCNNFGE